MSRCHQSKPRMLAPQLSTQLSPPPLELPSLPLRTFPGGTILRGGPWGPAKDLPASIRASAASASRPHVPALGSHPVCGFLGRLSLEYVRSHASLHPRSPSPGPHPYGAFNSERPWKAAPQEKRAGRTRRGSEGHQPAVLQTAARERGATVPLGDRHRQGHQETPASGADSAGTRQVRDIYFWAYPSAHE